MSEKKKVPVYQRLGPSGSARQQVAGVSAKLKDGEKSDAAKAVWLVRADTLGGLAPRPGDRCQGTDGVWWKVVKVGELDKGAYPCQCEREKSE